MYDAGLVSVSFRSLSVDDVIRAASNAGLKYIEWGSDSHAPNNDMEQLQKIALLQKQYGVACCSYGTYFTLGVSPVEELLDYIRAAKILGTNILRLWAGEISPAKYSEAERQSFFSQCRQAAKLAEEHGVRLCMECHGNSYTETKESALELMKAVNSPAFCMYWQANRTLEENVDYARLLKDYTIHIHVFNLKGSRKFPLEEAIEDWKTYLKEFSGDHLLLLEFMPDGKVETLPREADSLRKIIAG